MNAPASVPIYPEGLAFQKLFRPSHWHSSFLKVMVTVYLFRCDKDLRLAPTVRIRDLSLGCGWLHVSPSPGLKFT